MSHEGVIDLTDMKRGSWQHSRNHQQYGVGVDLHKVILCGKLDLLVWEKVWIDQITEYPIYRPKRGLGKFRLGEDIESVQKRAEIGDRYTGQLCKPRYCFQHFVWWSDKARALDVVPGQIWMTGRKIAHSGQFIKPYLRE